MTWATRAAANRMNAVGAPAIERTLVEQNNEIGTLKRTLESLAIRANRLRDQVTGLRVALAVCFMWGATATFLWLVK